MLATFEPARISDILYVPKLCLKTLSRGRKVKKSAKNKFKLFEREIRETIKNNLIEYYFVGIEPI